MIGVRTRYSLAQFLELQEPAVCVVILGKYGVQHLSLSREQLLYDLLNTLRGLDDRTLMLALSEVVATTGDLRARVNPKYRFDERMHDLAQCLLLDGYIIQEKKLVQTDPSIADAAPLEDDLVTALQNSGAPPRAGHHRQDLRLGRGIPGDAARLQRIARQRPSGAGNLGR